MICKLGVSVLFVLDFWGRGTSFSLLGQDEYGSVLLSSPGAEKSMPPCFSEPSQKCNQSILCPRFPIELYSPCLCLNILFSGMQLSYKSPNLTDSLGTDPVCPSQGRKGDLVILLPFAEPLPGEWSQNHATVRSLRQHRAENRPPDSRG